MGVLLIAWLVCVEVGCAAWYRVHEGRMGANADWSVRLPDSDRRYSEVAVPGSVSGQFRADEAIEARWKDDSGKQWFLYYFRWFPAHSLQRRVATQLAKTHGPEKCLPAAGMKLEEYLGVISVPVGGMNLAMQQYRFSAEGIPVHVFYGIYEDPSGCSKLANRRKDSASRLQAAMDGSRNFGQRFLELAVTGCDGPEEAREAVTRELGILVQSPRSKVQSR